MQLTTVLATLSAAAAVQAQLAVTPIGGTPVATQVAAPPATTPAPAPAAANNVYTTVVDWFTTVCAAPTTITYNSVLYTATTQYQTLTITNCPCTLTQTSTYAAASVTPTSYVVGGANKVAGGLVGALAAGAAALVL